MVSVSVDVLKQYFVTKGPVTKDYKVLRQKAVRNGMYQHHTETL